MTVAPRGGGPRLSVAIEDTDPYREAYHHAVQPRQTAGQLAAWQASVTAAWCLLTRLNPERAAAAAGLWTALVPLRPEPHGRSRSSSAREAFGVVATTPERDPVRLAETVVHETAHIALGALTDLADLTDPHDRTRHRVGWRPDPRPVGAVLTGTYAHLALLEFWLRRRQTLDGARADDAEARLHHYGRQVTAALLTLRNHPAPTSLGARFVEAMADEAARCGFPVRGPSAVHPVGGPGDESHHRVTSRDVAPPVRPPGRPPPPDPAGAARGEAAAAKCEGKPSIETRRGGTGGQGSVVARRECEEYPLLCTEG